ncbi:hypothetical protein [Chryseobacterium binzhouense]|uniref:hypothetical protein n=1 Tax=Chryseobacterium binzhouense TaxID=2593646 RepID=UPI00117E85D5|nr:hypothetical protein [Chryseobacterium binzhouense]
MALINEQGIFILHWDDRSWEKYWKLFSHKICEKFGNQNIEEHEKVKTILHCLFDEITDLFTSIIQNQKDVWFFKYVFHFNNNYIDLLLKSNFGKELEQINYKNFVINRRVLGLILEQGCDVDITRTEYDDSKKRIFRETLEDLLYIGSWAYFISDFIAIQSMLGDSLYIDIDKENIIEIKYKSSDIEKIYEHFYKESDYHFEQAQHNASIERINNYKTEVQNNFGFNYDFALGLLNEIQKHHNPLYSNLEDIEFGILEQNLIKNGGDETLVRQFYNGLYMSSDNKQNIKEAVRRPHNINRFHYKPLLVYKINNEKRVLSSLNKITETSLMLHLKAYPWNEMYDEWKSNRKMKEYVQNISNITGRSLERNIEDILKLKDKFYDTNLTSLKTINNQNIDIIKKCGEIDFIFLDVIKKNIYVADAKFLRLRTENVGYKMDFSSFITKLEPQLTNKVEYICDNIDLLNTHFQIKYKDQNIDISTYNIIGCFIISTPTLYMYCDSKFPIYTLGALKKILINMKPYEDIEFQKQTASNIIYPYRIEYPYLKSIRNNK